MSAACSSENAISRRAGLAMAVLFGTVLGVTFACVMASFQDELNSMAREHEESNPGWSTSEKLGVYVPWMGALGILGGIDGAVLFVLFSRRLIVVRSEAAPTRSPQQSLKNIPRETASPGQ